MPPREQRCLSILVAVGDLGTSQPWRGNAMPRADAPFRDKHGREDYERGVRMCGDVTVLAVDLTESRIAHERAPKGYPTGTVLV